MNGSGTSGGRFEIQFSASLNALSVDSSEECMTRSSQFVGSGSCIHVKDGLERVVKDNMKLWRHYAGGRIEHERHTSGVKWVVP